MHQSAAIMFTDIQGYTAMMRQDEENALKIRQKHREIFEEITVKNGGVILQYFGDGTLSIFDRGLEAVECAIELQKHFKASSVPVRIGLHTGQIEYDLENIVGNDVGLASQIEPLGIAGAVLISQRVNDEISNQAHLNTKSLGQFKFRNPDTVQEVYVVDHPELIVPERSHLLARKWKIGRGKRRRKRIAAVAVIAIVIAFLAAPWIYTSLFFSEPKPIGKSIAVLPFTNLSDNPAQQYLSDGITNEIINHLANIDDIRVISRNSIMKYRNSNKSNHEIAKELGVSNVLSGSIQKSGNSLRVSAQLVNVETKQYLWAETFDRELSGIFSIESSLAIRIAKTLEATFTQIELDRIKSKPTNNMLAYDSYLQGFHQFETYTRDGYYNAIDLFQQTIDSDPNFASAYAWQALCYVYLASWAGDLAPEEAKEMALPVAIKALELNEDLYPAYNAMALINFWFDWDFEEAERWFKLGLEKAPQGVNTVFYQQFLLNLGRFEEALALGKRGLETDPLHYALYMETGLSYYLMTQYDLAVETLQKGILINPDIADLHNKLGKVYLSMGKPEEALLQLGKGLDILETRPPSILAYQAIAYHEIGELDSVTSIQGELVKRHLQGEKGIAYYLAHLENSIGNTNTSFDWLEVALKDREVELIWLKVEPNFTNLREDQRFQSILKDVGLI